MLIKESEKAYIECRVFILGERHVGKKSFINRILTLPSTSVIRNFELEKEFAKKIEDLQKKIDEEEEFMRESQQNKYNRNIKNKTKTETLTQNNSNTLTKKSNQNEIKTDTNNNIKKVENDNNNNNNQNIIQKEFKTKFYPMKIEKSKIYHRPPVPECPSKLFNIFKTKLIFKPYFIPPAEDLSYDSYPKDDDDSDYEFEKEYKITLKGVKKDINQIMNYKKSVIELDKLYGYKIYIYYIFLILYDLSDYSSFETLIKYYDRLEKKYDLSNDENIISCIIGNKKDKNIFYTEEQSKTINEFITKYKIQNYEISTKPYYNFPKFFTQFIIDNLGPLHPEIFKEENFENELKKIIENKSNFSKALRASLTYNENNPGPEYDLNIYSFNTMKELKDALMNKKTRFSTKIFANKQGPVINYSKSSKDILSIENTKEKKTIVYLSSGGILNKPIQGFSFGVAKGRLNLIKTRKDLIRERNKDLLKSIEGDFSLCLKSSTNNIKSENYFDEANARKSMILSKRINDRLMKLEKIERIHKNNLDKLEEQKNQKVNLLRSSSAPDINLTYEKYDLMEKNKKRYYEKVFGKNKEYLDKFNERRKIIELNMIKEQQQRNKMLDEEREKERELELEKELEKKKENERREKFRIRLNTMRPIKATYNINEGPSFPKIKDEFEILAEKNEKKNKIIREFKPRFEEIKKEKINKPYNDKEIWKKWETNKIIMSKKGRLRRFLDERKKKEKEHKENIVKIEKQNEEIKKLRREILMEKGYEDPSKIKTINYSQVEEASPKYTIKGRNLQNNKKSTEDYTNFLIGQDKDVLDYLKNVQINRPLPNINTIKPNLPNIIFPKAERFFNYNKSFEGSDDLFKDGVFAPKTQEDFFNKGTFTKDEKRGLEFKGAENYPSPCDYKIKSSFEIIAEKGKAISDVRKQIKINDKIKKENRLKMLLEKSKKDTEIVNEIQNNQK